MAFQKVMISGIHTSELTVLKEEEKMALLREIQETGSKAARDKLIQGNLRLVLSVIQRFTGRGEDMEDLFQVGVVGLIKAINHFDLSKEVRFSNFAGICGISIRSKSAVPCEIWHIKPCRQKNA